MAVRFVVVVPVKSPGAGKSRLLGVDDRALLAAAFATDMVSACLATPAVEQVLVTTDDHAFAAELRALGAATTTDAGGGLNAALIAASHEAARRWPELHPVAVLADLPALRPADLHQALTVVAESPGASWSVPDADGTGTVLYSAPLTAFRPRFGPDSAARHRADGVGVIDAPLTSLRRDVDDATALRQAAALGVGPATSALLVVVPTQT